jgi:hypothetical protein
MTDTDGISKFSLERFLESVEELVKLCVEALFILKFVPRDKFAPRVKFPFYDLSELKPSPVKIVQRREAGFKDDKRVANLVGDSLRRFGLADFIRVEGKFSFHVVASSVLFSIRSSIPRPELRLHYPLAIINFPFPLFPADA